MSVSTGYCEGCGKRLSACICKRRPARTRKGSLLERSGFGERLVASADRSAAKIVGSDPAYTASIDKDGRFKVVKTHRIELNEFARDAVIGIMIGLCVMALFGAF